MDTLNRQPLLEKTPAAQRAGVCTRTLTAAADRGELPVIRTVRGARLFEAEAVDRWAAARRLAGKA
jgi:excisionase family DNA binding protein